MQPLRLNKLHPAFWLALALAVIATSCATTSGNHPVTNSGEPVKGATLLMQH